MIKICVDPYCEEIAHNIDKSEKRCRTCNGSMIRINDKTYNAKFSKHHFQYDYKTGHYFRSNVIVNSQTTLNL